MKHAAAPPCCFSTTALLAFGRVLGQSCAARSFSSLERLAKPWRRDPCCANHQHHRCFVLFAALTAIAAPPPAGNAFCRCTLVPQRRKAWRACTTQETQHSPIKLDAAAAAQPARGASRPCPQPRPCLNSFATAHIVLQKAGSPRAEWRVQLPALRSSTMPLSHLTSTAAVLFGVFKDCLRPTALLCDAASVPTAHTTGGSGGSALPALSCRRGRPRSTRGGRRRGAQGVP
jgi:hypothetical protein